MANVLTRMEEDTELFETLLYSYSNRFRAVNNVNDRYIDYSEKINYFVTHLIRTSFDRLVFSCLRWMKSPNS